MEICTPHSVSERVCVPAKVCRLGSRFGADIGIPGRAQRLAVGCLQASFCKVLRGKKKRLLLACSQHACVFLLIPGTWDPSLTLAMTAAKCRRILVRFPASRRRQFQKWGMRPSAFQTFKCLWGGLVCSFVVAKAAVFVADGISNVTRRQ